MQFEELSGDITCVLGFLSILSYLCNENVTEESIILGSADQKTKHVKLHGQYFLKYQFES